MWSCLLGRISLPAVADCEAFRLPQVAGRSLAIYPMVEAELTEAAELPGHDAVEAEEAEAQLARALSWGSSSRLRSPSIA